ncbi:hypothetical protein LT493_40995 [Streptomyces tricolor]|nr:hypothetical protein [Streptomyces tricolor]
MPTAGSTETPASARRRRRADHRPRHPVGRAERHQRAGEAVQGGPRLRHRPGHPHRPDPGHGPTRPASTRTTWRRPTGDAMGNAALQGRLRAPAPPPR